MRLSVMAVPALCLLYLAHPLPGRGQAVSLAAAAGPVFLPGSGTGADWHGLIGVGIQREALGARLEAMYAGVPGADLVALTGNLVWILRPGELTERRGRQVGPLRLFAEVRYHRVTRRFEEARDADTFVPVSVGVALGR